MNTIEMKKAVKAAKVKRELELIAQQKLAEAEGKDVQPLPSERSWVEATAFTIGAAPSAIFGFGDSIATSFQYHEAKRKGLL